MVTGKPHHPLTPLTSPDTNKAANAPRVATKRRAGAALSLARAASSRAPPSAASPQTTTSPREVKAAKAEAVAAMDLQKSRLSWNWQFRTKICPLWMVGKGKLNFEFWRGRFYEFRGRFAVSFREGRFLLGFVGSLCILGSIFLERPLLGVITKIKRKLEMAIDVFDSEKSQEDGLMDTSWFNIKFRIVNSKAPILSVECSLLHIHFWRG